MAGDREFRIRPGRIRSTRVQQVRPFVAQALAAARKAGGTVSRSGRIIPGNRSRFGRGQRASIQANRLITARSRGAVVKARVVRHSGRTAPLSRRIRDMEDELGASLFQRHAGGVRLTIAGERFLGPARKALRHIDTGASDVAAVGRSEEGHVRVGVFSSLASGFLFDLLRQYGTLHPNVRVDPVEGNPAEHVAAVRTLHLDVAFITGTRTWEGCETEHLWCERVFVVLPDDHPLADKAEIGWPELAAERFIVSDVAPGQEVHNFLVAHLSDLGSHPDIQSHHVGRDNMLSLVAVGRGITLTSEATIVAKFPGITYRELAGEVLPFSMVWSARNDNPACRRLLSMARAARNL